MKPRYLLTATATTLLLTGAANAQQYAVPSQAQPYCREFTKVVDIGGKPEHAYGQACQQPDGSWQIVSDDISPNQPVQYMPEQNYVAYQPAPAYPSYPAYPAYPGYPGYYAEPTSVFSLSFNSWNPGHTRYYNDYGHHWREWNGPRGNGRPGNDWHGNDVHHAPVNHAPVNHGHAAPTHTDHSHDHDHH